MNNWIANSRFLPHGNCLIWQQDVLWLHAISDAFIALSYYSIPFGLIYFAHKRKDLAYRWMFVLFAVFIFACGSTHLMDIWTLWHPDYVLQGAVKAFTAAVSTLTAIVLWPLIPPALEIPTRAALTHTNRRLEEEANEHRRTEARLRESEERFRTMADSAPVMIWLTDANFRRTYCNRSFLAFSGHTRPGENGCSVFAHVHPDDRVTTDSIYSNAIAARESFQAEYRVRAADGHYAWVWDTGEPRYSYDGEFLGYIGSTVDITHRKSAELRLSEAKLFLESVVENIPHTVIVKNAQTLRYVSINHAGTALFGYSLNVLVDKSDNDLFPEQIAEQVTRHDRHTLSALTVHEVAEERLQNCLGKEILAHTKRLALRNESGTATFLLWIIEDITEARRTEHQLQQRRVELVYAQRLLTVNELGTSLAHELNQPIGAIANYTEGAIRRFADVIEERPDLGGVLKKIQELSIHAGDIFRNLRTLVQKGKLDFKPVPINALIKETLRLIAGETARKNVTVNLALAEQLPLVDGNEVTLQQLLLNLLLNGLEAMDNIAVADRELFVTTAWQNPSSIEVRIADRGVGIPNKVMAHLYEPFFSTKAGGIGLGLSICRSIIEAHRGTLQFHTNNSGGTVVVVTLPCRNVTTS